MAKTKIPHVLLLIDRDASTKIPALVPEYEQVILEEIYGEDLVHEVEEHAQDIEVEDFDTQKAFDGLVSKYQATADGDRARKMFYPKLRDLEKRVGIKAGAQGGGKSSKAASKPEGDSLADGTVAEITAQLESLSDDELEQLAKDEAAGKDRSGVHAAIEAERAKRSSNQ